MKNKLLLFLATPLLASMLNAQSPELFFSSNNSANSADRAQFDVSEKSMIRFNTDITTPQQRDQFNQDRLNYLNSVNPNYGYERNSFEETIQQYINKHANQPTAQLVVTIPVVVHVVYNTAAQNISTNQVLSQIQVLNEDFGRTNADANAHWAAATNTTIQFCLAQQDPLGNASTGIDRVSTSTTSFSSNDNVKHSATGGANAWDPTRYLNIWVCNLGGGLLGYGEFPTAAVSQTFGVVILYTAFGSNFTSYGAFATVNAPYDRGRTTTHEFSHCFNLYHIWGDDGGACTGSDLCADTPNQADATTTCFTYPHTDACSGTSPGIMFENYMDYSYDNCLNLFTANQKTRMLAVLATAPYNALSTSTACQSPASSPPTALFSPSATSVCPNTAITFTDMSTNNTTTWAWTFPSGSPASSSVQNPPAVTWTAAGTYTVTLVASNVNGSSTYTMVITVLGVVSPPLVEGFEATTFPPTGWTNYDAGANGMVWGRYAVGHNSSFSAQFDNFTSNVAGTRDELRTPKLNLASASTVTMTFDVAYKRYNATTSNYDSLEVCVSSDCGATWTNVYQKGGTTLQTVTTTQTTLFVPTNTQWRTETVNLNAYAGNPGLMIAFRNRGHYGQAIYVDNVNITTTASAVPSATFTASATTVCAGTAVAFTDASSGTPTSWSWTFPSGTPATATTQNVASVVWNTAGTYTVTHTATNANGTGTTTQVITVNALPTITTTTTGATICSGNSTTITAAGGTTYAWMPGSLTGTTVTVTPTTTTTYTVTGTNANGCTNTATRTITVNPTPTVTATATSATICSGGSTTLSATGASTYNWNPGNHNGTPWTVTPATTTTYTVTGTAANGCTATATQLITVTPTPTVTTTATSTTICNGSSTTITASGATTYTWMPGSLSGTSVTVSPTTTTTYTVTGTSGSCTGTATRTITVNPSPTVTTTTTGATICSGSSTTITGAGASTYAWMPGSLTGTTVTVTPATTTTYTVTGTAANGCTGTATRVITVNPTPTVTATASSTSICTGNSVTLSATGATTYLWNPGALSGASVTTTPGATTTYTVTGTSAGCTSTATVTVTVGAPPTITASAASPSICNGSSTTITAVGGATYLWMPGSLTGASISVTPATTTSYTVTGSSGPGCSGTATVTVTVNPIPTITATISNATVCNGSSVTLTANGGSTYNWNPGNFNGSPATDAPTASTNYTVTGTDAAGCSNTATVSVVVNPSPTVTATISSTTICSGNSVTLTANGATTYNWMPGNLNGGTVTDAPTASTTYTVTGTDAAGCIGTATVAVSVNPTPTVTATISSSSVCAGTSITLTANGATTYNWMPGNINGSPVVDTPTSTTTYTVTGTDVNGCSSTATITATINQLPVVVATASNNSICIGSTVTLNGTGASTYDWQPINVTTSTATDTPTGNTTYTLTGTDVNGCVGTDTANVSVYAQPTISISGPTVICPGSSVTLTAAGASTYTWQPGGQTTTTITDTPTVATTYTVTGTDVSGCSNTATQTVSIDTPPSTPSITVNGSVLTSTVTGNAYQWFLNGNPIAGATSQSYTATGLGSYTVEVYDVAGCGSGQSSAVVDPTGINVNTEVEFVNIIPNPNDGHFMLNFHAVKTDNYVLEIHDVLGQIIYSESLNNFNGAYSHEVNLSTYGKGVYTISIRSSTTETVVKSITY